MDLFEQHGVPVPRGRVAAHPAEARSAAVALGGPVVVSAMAQLLWSATGSLLSGGACRRCFIN